MGELLKTTAKGVTWTTLSAIARNLVSLIQITILARLLAKEDFGLIAMANVFVGFTQIFLDMGISVGILHHQNITKNEFSSLYWLNIFTGIFLAGTLMLLAPLFAQLNDAAQELTPIIRLLSLSIFFAAVGSQHRTVQQKEMRFKTLALIDISIALITLVTAILLAKRGAGVYSLVYSTLLGSITSSIIYLIVGLIKDRNIRLHFKIKETYSFLKIGVYQIGSSFLDYFSNEIDTLFIGSAFGNNTLGLYSLCKKIIIAAYNTINPIFTRVLTPLFAKIQKEKQHLKDFYLKLVESLCIINFPVYFMISIFSYGILMFLYGEQYVAGSFVLSILALYYGILTASNPVGSLQVALGRTDIGFYWTIYRVSATIVIVYIGSKFNVEIMVSLFLLMSILNTIIAWKIQIYKMIELSFKSYIRVILRPLMSSIIIAIPFYVFFSKIFSIWLIVLLCMLFCIIYFIFARIAMKDSYLINLLNNIINSKLKKIRTEV